MSYIPATSPVPLPLGGAYAPSQSPVPLPLSGAAGGIEPVQRGYAVPVLSFTATGPAQAEFALPAPLEIAGEAITQQNMFDLPQLSIAAEMTHTPYYYWFGDTSEITSGQPWRHQHWNLLHDYIFDKTLEAYGTADTNRHCDFVDADRQGDFIFWRKDGNSIFNSLGPVFVTNRRVYVIDSANGKIYYADLDDGVAPESFSRYRYDGDSGWVGNLPSESVPIYIHGSELSNSDRLYFFGDRNWIFTCEVYHNGEIGPIIPSDVPLPWDGDGTSYNAYNHFVTPVVCSDILYVFRDSVVDGSVAWTKINRNGTLRGDWQYKPLTSSRSSRAEYIYVRAPNRYKHDRIYRFCGNTCNDPDNGEITFARTIDYIEVNKATGEILTGYEEDEISFIEYRDILEAYPSNSLPPIGFLVSPESVTSPDQLAVNSRGFTINACSTGRYLLCEIAASVSVSETLYYRVLAEIQDDASLSVFIPCANPRDWFRGYPYFITSSRIYSFCGKYYDGSDKVHRGDTLNLSERKADKFLTGETVSGEFLGGSDNLVTFDPTSPKYVLRRMAVGGGEVPSIYYNIPPTAVLAKADQMLLDYVWPHKSSILFIPKVGGIRVSEYPPGTTLARTDYDLPSTVIKGYHRLPGWNEGHYYIPKEKVFAYGIRSGIGLFDAFAGYLLPVPLAVYANGVFTPPIVVDYVLPGPEIQGTASASEPITVHVQYILPLPVQVQGWGEAAEPTAVRYILPLPVQVKGVARATPPVTARYILPFPVRSSGKGRVPVAVQYDLPSTLRIRAKINNVVATARYDLPLPVRTSGQVFGFQYELPDVRIQGFACGSVQHGNPVALYSPKLLRVQGQAVYSALQTARCRIKMPVLDVRQGRLVPGAILSGLDIRLHNLRVRADGAVNSVAVTISLPHARVSAQMLLRTGAEFDAEHSGTVQFILPLLDIEVDSESAQVQELRSTVYRDGMGYVFRPSLFDGYGIVSPAVLAGVYDLSGVIGIESRVDVGRDTPVFQYNREMEV